MTLQLLFCPDIPEAVDPAAADAVMQEAAAEAAEVVDRTEEWVSNRSGGDIDPVS